MGTYGTLRIAGDGSYIYTLTDNHLNATADDGVQTITGLESFTYTVSDAAGNTATGSITVSIIDDVPVATDDGLLGSAVEGTSGTVVGTLSDLTGDDSFGADGQHATTPVTIATGSLGGTRDDQRHGRS